MRDVGVVVCAGACNRVPEWTFACVVVEGNAGSHASVCACVSEICMASNCAVHDRPAAILLQCRPFVNGSAVMSREKHRVGL